MKTLLVVLAYLCLAAHCELPKGTEFLGKGFDVTKGNLKPTSVEEVQTNFGKPNIFSANEDSDIDSVTLNAGQFTISAKEITTISEVTSEYSVTVSVSGAVKAFSGSASTTVREFTSKFSSSYSSSYVADSIVSVAKYRLLAANFNDEFNRDLEVLPTSYDKATNGAQFLTFINKWGTHYIREATVGGRTSFTAFVTKTQEKEFRSKSVNVKAGVGAAFKVAVSVDVETSTTNTDYQEVSTAGVEISAFAMGGTVGLLTDYTAWSATVAENPMPIFCEIVPYIYLIEDATKREALKAALVDYIIGSLSADNTLELVWTGIAFQIWSDGGSGASRDVSTRRPEPAPGYLRFGDSTSAYFAWPTVKELAPAADFFSVAGSYNSPLLKNPIDYGMVWGDFGSGADQDGSFWAPSCPTNYRPLAHLSQDGYNKPPTNLMACVHDRCVVQCAVGLSLWDDSGSGADSDVTLWGVLENEEGMSVNGMIAMNYYGTPPIDQFFCLKRKCVAPPLVVNETVSAEIASYFSSEPSELPASGSLSAGVTVVISMAFVCVAALFSMFFKL